MKRLVLAFVVLLGCQARAGANKGGPSEFSGPTAFTYVEKQMAFGPRIPNKPGHKQTGDWLLAELRARADTVIVQEIRHVTQYRYAAQVRESTMELWMQPQKTARQRLVSFDVELDPPAQLFSYADTFGNPVYHFDVPQPHERLTITAHSAVETQPPPPLPGQLDVGEWDRLRSDFVRGEQFDYLRPHGFAR